MKKLICFFLVILVLVSPALAADCSTLVYTTRTGECYHRYSCSCLSKSCYETTLAQAVANGYRPCGRCHPPTLDAGSSSDDSSKTALERLVEDKIAANNSSHSSSGSSYSGYSSGSSSYSSGSSSSRSSSRASVSSSRSEVSPLLKIGRILFAAAVLYPIWMPIVVLIRCAFEKLFKKE